MSDTSQLQISTATIDHRSHHEFKLLSQYPHIDWVNGAKILSFGCSTGEEAASLKHFFPNARVIGCDINNDALKAARARFANIEFIHSNADLIRKHGPFDLITCCSVLCVHPNITVNGSTKGLSYNVWTEILDMLCDSIAPSGLLFLYNSNFPFRYHSQSANFYPIDEPQFNGSGFVSIFTPDEIIAAYGHLKTNYSYQPVGFPWHTAGPTYNQLVPNDFKNVLFARKNGADYVSRLSKSSDFDKAQDLIGLGEFSFRYSPVLLDSFKNKPTTYLVPNVEYKITKQACIIRRKLSRKWFDEKIVYETVADYVLPKQDTRWFMKQFRATVEII